MALQVALLCLLGAAPVTRAGAGGLRSGPRNTTAENASEQAVAGDNLTELDLGSAMAANASLEAAANLVAGGGWWQGGDKMWGSGTGMESIHPGNAKYYDRGMDAARSRCGDSGCALITNPAGHRTVHTFHIHFVHYQGSYAQRLKNKLEERTCRSDGWHSGGLPCGGRAKFFEGSPGIFSAAMTGGSIDSASVIAWPASCGGRGTIVELAFGCSIEHNIRGDYDPSKR